MEKKMKNMNNKLTKEECKEAMDRLYRPYLASTTIQNDFYKINGKEHSINDDSNLLEQLINEHFELVESIKSGECSDGYHTFNELYYHRAVLFSVILKDHKELAWKSKKHHDGTMFDGMFIVGIDTPKGQYSYHYDLNLWSLFDVKELDNAPKWDGHKPKDIDRLLSLNDNPSLKFEELCENEPIFDNDDFYYCWYLILMIDYETKQLYIVDYDGNFKWINFEENRFYRKQAEE